jgi:trehalose 6-phosphate phosphatase
VTGPVPRTEAGRAGLAALRAEPARALLAFDFDGTLSPIVDDPAQAHAHPEVAPRLHELAGRVARIAIVTGRPAEVAVELGGIEDVPGLVVMGHYGLQRWESGRLSSPDTGSGVAQARALLPGLLADLAAPEGTVVEDKDQSLAVHVRRTPDPQAAYDLLTAPMAMLAARTGLTVEPGRYVLELRPAGFDKGRALRALAHEVEAGSVAFFGDDLGDLAAFAAVEGLRAGGTPGLLVCSGSDEVVELARRADVVVDGPEGVVAFLAGLLD